MLLITLKMPLFYSRVSLSQRVQYQDPETAAAEWNSAIIHLVIYIYTDFSAVTCRKSSMNIMFFWSANVIILASYC